MLVATWNVNSIRARLDRFTSWLIAVQPDVVCLQETKVEDPSFPFNSITDLGYNTVINGQKGYNGVAILSKSEIFDVQTQFGDGLDKHGARFISAIVKDMRIMSIYAPNGASVELEQYQNKLKWYDSFIEYLEGAVQVERQIIIGGDFNIACKSIDIDRPSDWEGTVLYNEVVCRYLDSLEELGFADTFRIHHKGRGFYSWWDYRNLGFQTNNGLRIDYLFANSALSGLCDNAYIDRDQRKGFKPSDHAPVLANFLSH